MAKNLSNSHKMFEKIEHHSPGAPYIKIYLKIMVHLSKP